MFLYFNKLTDSSYNMPVFSKQYNFWRLKKKKFRSLNTLLNLSNTIGGFGARHIISNRNNFLVNLWNSRIKIGIWVIGLINILSKSNLLGYEPIFRNDMGVDPFDFHWLYILLNSSRRICWLFLISDFFPLTWDDMHFIFLRSKD